LWVSFKKTPLTLTGLKPKHRLLSTWLLVGLIQTSVWILVWTPIGQQFGKCMSGEVVGIFFRWLDERVCDDEIVSERIIHAFGNLLVRRIISGRSHRFWIFSLGYFLFFCKSYFLSFPLIKYLFH